MMFLLPKIRKVLKTLRICYWNALYFLFETDSYFFC
jgi:ribosomal protein L30/L7E